MSSGNPIAVPEAARRLGVNTARVRALISSEGLSATKVGGRWLVDAESVEQRKRRGVLTGRPFSSAMAWTVLALASGLRPRGMHPSAISRARRWLREGGLENEGQRLDRRARCLRYRAHPSDLARILKERQVVRTGLCAAADLGLELATTLDVDAYLPARRFGTLVRRYALVESDRANVTFRVVASQWPFARGEHVAPATVVAIDLIDSDDSRARRAGHELLRRSR